MAAWPRGVVLLLCLGLLLAICLTMIPRSSWSDDDLEQGLKVAYLYNFTRFIEWPEATLGNDFVITVIGDPILAAALRALERPDRRAQGRPIFVRAVDDPDEIGDCQILFIGAAAVSQLPRLLARTDGRPILLVGDSRGLARRGIAINCRQRRAGRGRATARRRCGADARGHRRAAYAAVRAEPPVLHRRGLAAALDWLAGNARERWGIVLTCAIAADLPVPGREPSAILFQCARELVYNLIKHSGARTGSIGLKADDEGLQLTVEDDGRGFDPIGHDGGARVQAAATAYIVCPRAPQTARRPPGDPLRLNRVAADHPAAGGARYRQRH